MKSLLKRLAVRKREKIAKLIAARHKRVNYHVYTEAEILSNCTTRVWICVDGTRIMLITDYQTGRNIPHVSTTEADRYIDFVKRQYYLANRHGILRYEQGKR